MSKKPTQKEIPELEGWLTLPDAAKMMKLSRQYVHRMAALGRFKSLRRVGSTFIVSTAEALDLTLRRGLDTEEDNY